MNSFQDKNTKKSLLSKIYDNKLFPYNILKKSSHVFVGLSCLALSYFTVDLKNTMENVPTEYVELVENRTELASLNKSITSIQQITNYKENFYFTSYVDSLEQKVEPLINKIEQLENSFESKEYYYSTGKDTLGMFLSVFAIAGGIVLGLYSKGRERDIK